MITSGKNGKTLLPLIHSEPLLIGIIIFCSHPEYHKEWASKYKKVIKIVNNSFEEVAHNIKPYFFNYLCSYLFSSLDTDQGNLITILITRKYNIENEELNKFEEKKDDKSLDYLTISYDTALHFSLIIKNLIKTNKSVELTAEKRMSIVEELMNMTEIPQEKLIIKERFSN